MANHLAVRYVEDRVVRRTDNLSADEYAVAQQFVRMGTCVAHRIIYAVYVRDQDVYEAASIAFHLAGRNLSGIAYEFKLGQGSEPAVSETPGCDESF
jgi:hypothetical protein